MMSPLKKLIVAILASGYVTLSFGATASIRQIESYLRNNEPVQAYKETNAFLKMYPYSAKGLYYMAQLEAHRTNYSAAKESLDKAMYIDKSYSFGSNPGKVKEFRKNLIQAIQNQEQQLRLQKENFRKSEILAMNASVEADVLVLPIISTKIELPTTEVASDIQKHTFLWVFAGLVVLVAGGVIFMVRRFNRERIEQEKWQNEVQINEQHIVIKDLYRVLNQIEIIAKNDHLDGLLHEVVRLRVLTEEQKHQLDNTPVEVEKLTNLVLETKRCKAASELRQDISLKK